MECLFCYFRSSVSDVKDHYRNYHLIDSTDGHFLNLFRPDYLEDDKCFECSLRFINSRKKKNHMFLVHYNQKGGARANTNFPLNILKRDSITYYSVNFNKHKIFYNFYCGDMVDEFLGVVYRTFKPLKNINYKFQAYFEIVNQQRKSDNQNFLTDNRSCVNNVYRFKYFNEFLRAELKNEITKRIISNGLTGSSWYFRRFERLNVIVLPLTRGVRFITG